MPIIQCIFLDNFLESNNIWFEITINYIDDICSVHCENDRCTTIDIYIYIYLKTKPKVRAHQHSSRRRSETEYYREDDTRNHQETRLVCEIQSPQVVDRADCWSWLLAGWLWLVVTLPSPIISRALLVCVCAVYAQTFMLLGTYLYIYIYTCTQICTQFAKVLKCEHVRTVDVYLYTGNMHRSSFTYSQSHHMVAVFVCGRAQ